MTKNPFKGLNKKINKGFNDIGKAAELGINTVKTTFQKAADKTESYAKGVIFGVGDYPPGVRDIISNYGSQTITSLQVARAPVPKAITTALNVASGGTFDAGMKSQPYDKLFHLFMYLTLQSGTKILFEKNAQINSSVNPSLPPNTETKDVPINQALTMNQFLENGKQQMGKSFFPYDPHYNNCQDFILGVLTGNKLITPDVRDFIKQDTGQLFANNKVLGTVAKGVTSLGGIGERLIHGFGIHQPSGSVVQSVLFDKPKYTNVKAVKWLIKHGYTKHELDEKPNHLRYRQCDPKVLEREGYHFVNKHLGKGVTLVLAYKKILSRKNNMRNKYDSDTGSDSESDGEHDIINKMSKLKRQIRDHHELHGGKINIAKAFKSLGATVKKGFAPVEDYITAKKGGLASMLVNQGIPAVTGALGGTAAEFLVPEGGPLSAFVGSQLGSMGGRYAAKAIDKAAGTGMRRGRGRPRKSMSAGDLVHNDIGSHNAKGNMSGGKLKQDLVKTYNSIVPKSMQPTVNKLAGQVGNYALDKSGYGTPIPVSGGKLKQDLVKTYNSIVPKSMQPTVNKLAAQVGNYALDKSGYGKPIPVSGSGMKRKGRMVKGSPEAMAFGMRMREAKAAKKR